MSDWRFGAAPPAGSIAELRRGETMVPRCRPPSASRGATCTTPRKYCGAMTNFLSQTPFGIRHRRDD